MIHENLKCAGSSCQAGVVAARRGAYRCDAPIQNFGGYIASLRKARGLTQKDYSALIGVSRRSINTAEGMRWFWQTDTVELIVRFEGLDLRFLREAYKRKFWGDA